MDRKMSLGIENGEENFKLIGECKEISQFDCIIQEISKQ
jgi:hypothetical protein